MSSKRPNFLFLITDQQRADWLGCYGHPVLKTPNIDAIASEGMRFNNFHVASPVCMPNRASLHTGRYPSVHQLRHNGCRLPLSANTFVDVLANAGYHTASIGKSHLQPFTGSAPVAADNSNEVSDMEAWKPDQGDYGLEEPSRYTTGSRYELNTPYYGYQYVDMVVAHGDRCGGHYHQWFKEKADDWQALHDNANQIPHNYTCPQAYRTPIPEELYPTAYIRDSAIKYLSSRQHENEPFFAFVSFPDPHHPFNPPGKYWDMYSPDEFDISLPYSAHKNPTPPMQWLHNNWRNGGEQIIPQIATMADDQHILETMALTAGMMAFIDDAVGDITKALQDTGLKDNTVVCYNSDHGDFLGDFNMLLKGALPFKSITRVPFIWSDPDIKKSGSTDVLASTIDIASTVLNRAGLKPFNGNQGENLLDAMQDDKDVRNDLLIEFNDGGKRLSFEKPARVRSIVTHDWRYTVYLDEDWGELYHLKSDPDETNNLWNSDKHRDIRFEFSEKMNHHLIRQMDASPKADRVA